MGASTGIDKPSSRGIRDPLSNKQEQGRIVNPPRFNVFGGFSSKVKGFFKNALAIMKPGDTK